MNDRPDLTDEALRDLLEKRAGQPDVAGRLAAVRSVAATTAQQRPARLHLGFVHGLAAGAAGLAAVGVLALVVGLALGSKAPTSPLGATASGPASSSGPSARPSAAPLVPGAVEPVLPLTIDQLNAILLQNSSALLGRRLVIDATIAVNPAATRNVPCCSQPPFGGPPAILQGSTPILGIEIAAAASVPGPLPWTGTFAARMTDTRTVEYLEPVTLAPDGQPLKPSRLSSLSAQTRESGYVLVEGWIAGFDVPIPCAAPLVTPPPGPQYNGCAVTSSLSDTSSQPVTGTTFRVPPDGVQVQDGAYDDFAPDPQLISPFGTKPELATFLLDQALLPCPSGTYCVEGSTGFHWQIAARIDPWPTPSRADPPTPGPSASPAANQPVQPLTVAQLNAILGSYSLVGRQLVITGSIQIPVLTGRSLCCSSGAPGEPPAILVGSAPLLQVNPGAPTSPGFPFSGTFAAKMVDARTLDIEGAVTMSAAGSPITPSQLPVPSSTTGAGVVGSNWLVHGWISGLGVLPFCPSIPPTTATAEYGCGLSAFLSDDGRQPVTVGSSGYSVNAGAGSVVVQNGAYQAFAPAPESTGVQTQPEEATFLVQDTYVSTCATGELCSLQASNFHWVVVGRVDPVPLVAPAPSTSPAPSLQPVQPLTVGQLNAFMATNAQSLQGRQLVITGTIEPMTPVPSCVPPGGGCPPYVLVGTSPLLMIPRPQGIGPRSMLPPVVGVPSTFAASLMNGSTLQYEGPAETNSGGQAWLPSQLSAASEPSGAQGYWLVHGWISVSSIIPACGVQLHPTPNSGLPSGCGPLEFLSDDGSTPVEPSATSVEVQLGAYLGFAPQPSAAPPGAPEDATFLLQATSVRTASPQWQIVARVDPWPVAAVP